MKGIKVLIAGEKKQYISHLMKICKEYGAECTSETDPEAVAARIKNKELFDILIIDVSFTKVKTDGDQVIITEPKLNGVKIFEIAKHIYPEHNNNPYIPILCIAAGTKELYRFEQRAGIIFDFIQRPFRDSEIKSVMEKAIIFLSNKQE